MFIKGVLLNNSSASFTNSKILNFRASGIMGNLFEKNKIDVTRCALSKNLGAGFFTKGNGNVTLDDNYLGGNMGVGIKMINCKKMYITGNIMNDNLIDGAHFINCD